MAGSLLPHALAGAFISRSNSKLDDMQTRDSASIASALPVSVASSNRDQWAWLDAIGRSLNCGFLLVDPQGTPGPLIGAVSVVEPLRLLTTRNDPALAAAIRTAFASDRPHHETLSGLSVVCRRLTVFGQTAGALVIGSQDGSPNHPRRGSGGREAGHFARHDVADDLLATIEPWLTAAAEAHLGQRAPDDTEEAFDRIASLHRLLHDGLEGGEEREVLTAFAEALFAWDGIEAVGYVEDVQGEWRRAMSPPATALPKMLDRELGQLLRSKQTTRLFADELVRLGFSSDRQVAVIPLGETTPEPWILVFAEGYRSLNLQRLTLYADLFREALARLSNIVETRAAWAILQTLLGAGDRIEPTIDAALRDFSRVVDGVSVSLIVTNATGTTLLVAGDRESVAAVRPFDRGNRLVSTTHLADHGTMQLAVRRARGQSFTRREQHLVDRAAAIFSAWLPGALKKPVEKPGATAAARGFEEVLDRAATQIARDGLDVSLIVIVVPENEAKLALLQSWVTEIRARLRGSDLAGAISDREIGVLLSGTSHTDGPIVCARLGRSLGFEKYEPPTPMGFASRPAGSPDEGSIVGVARRNINGNGRKHKPTAKRSVT